jgi:hypothetical protein
VGASKLRRHQVLMSPVDGLTVNPNNLATHRHFSSGSHAVLEASVAHTVFGLRPFPPVTLKAADSKARMQVQAEPALSGSEWECLCHPEGGKKRTNMKVSPTILLIIKDRIFYPTMFMINKIVSSAIPRCC